MDEVGVYFGPSSSEWREDGSGGSSSHQVSQRSESDVHTSSFTSRTLVAGVLDCVTEVSAEEVS